MSTRVATATVQMSAMKAMPKLLAETAETAAETNKKQDTR
jgi:hypothetical protein